MLSWVTDGFIAPGVHFGSGKPPFTMWHSDGIVVVGLFGNVLFVLDSVDSLLDLVVVTVCGLIVRWLDDFGADDELAIDALLALFAFCCVCVVVLVGPCLGCGFWKKPYNLLRDSFKEKRIHFVINMVLLHL